jgi:hypothetical protein
MKACEATAPTPVLMCGTIAPTAKKRVATMMPMRPVGASLAMIDQVTAAPSGFGRRRQRRPCKRVNASIVRGRRGRCHPGRTTTDARRAGNHAIWPRG